jgi:hypothetical protein
MFLDIKWARIQGKRVAARGYTAFWENPCHKLAKRESYEQDEKHTDIRSGVFIQSEYMKSEWNCGIHVHRMLKTVLKAEVTMAKSRPISHLQWDTE